LTFRLTGVYGPIMRADGAGHAAAAVVTGASTGIGEACALRLDRMGFRVFAGVRKDADAERLRQRTPSLAPLFIDVTDAASIAAARERVAAAVGERGLAGLVNNAGIAVGGPLEFMPIAELRRQIEVNVIGHVAVTQSFLSLLRMGRGRIVNIGSIAGRLATPFLGPYAASKFALEAISDALRIELRPWGIGVSLVEPGSIATPIWEKSQAKADEMKKQMTSEAHALYDAAIAAVLKVADETGRRGVPADEVAKAVAHALTAKRPKTRYLVGFDARVQAALAAVVPDRLRDGLIERQLRLPRSAPADARAMQNSPLPSRSP
jgi:NAD(P)-dependent dehydrogenase (short-subunit alcohol dehydrogenase family)